MISVRSLCDTLRVKCHRAASANTAKQRRNQHTKSRQGQHGDYVPVMSRWSRRRERRPSCRCDVGEEVVVEQELALLLLLMVVAPASGVLVGAVVPNLVPCRCGASRRPIPQGGISHGIIIALLAGCGCNSVARFPDSQPCREFQPHLANQCKVRLIPVSPDQL